MGILRLYLAICIIGVHSESVLPWGSHGGREAVQIFFIISGFYMQFILESQKYPVVRNFYLSRALRIFVPYLIATALIVLASVVTGLTLGNWLSLTASIDHEQNGYAGTILAILTNGTLFFQDWVMFIKHDAGESLMFTSNFRNSSYPLHSYLWIPQAWSIGVELTFYIFAPIMVKMLTGLQFFSVIALSFVSRLFCYSQLGLAHDPWTYRFFPFEIVHFAYGILACRLLQHFSREFERITVVSAGLAEKFGPLFYPMLTTSLLGCLWLHFQSFSLLSLYAQDFIRGGDELLILASLSVWIIIVPILFSVTRQLSIDRFVGELSYPVYLLHYTIILIVGVALPFLNLPQSVKGEVATMLSIAAAILLQIWILKPFDIWRHHIFEKKDKRSCGINFPLTS